MKKNMSFDETKIKQSLFLEITKKLKSVYLTLLNKYSGLYFWNELPEFFPKEVYSEFLSLIEGDLAELSETLNIKASERLSTVERYHNWMDKLSQMYLQIDLYENHRMHIEFLCANIQAKANAGETAYNHDLNEKIIKKSMDYLNNFDNRSIEEKVANLMSVIPIKMTREKYYDYVRESIKNKYKTQPEHLNVYINSLKRRLNPMGYPGYGSVFLGIAELISNIEKEIPDENTELTNNELYNAIDEVWESLSELKEYNYIITELLNAMYEICTCMEVLLLYLPNWNDFFKDDLPAADLCYSIRENINSELKSEFLERIESITAKTVNPHEFLEVNKSLINQIEISNENLNDKEINEIYTTYLSILRTLFSDINVNSIKFFEETDEIKNTPSENEVDSITEEIIDYIKEVSGKLSPKNVKLLRQYSFLIINTSYSTEKVLSYLRDCLLSADAKYLNYCDNMLEELFFSEGYYVNEHQHHHQHHDGCCDHDHEHSHEHI